MRKDVPMGILDGVMQEEYDRINRIIHNIEAELKKLPRGYISEKQIKGNIYYYLQCRENKKMKSSYIKKKDIDSYRILIAHRKELEQELRERKQEKKKLEKVLK